MAGVPELEYHCGISDSPRKCWEKKVKFTPTNITVKWIFAHVESNVYPENSGTQRTKLPIIANIVPIARTITL